jgi:L-fuculose-phosphate aldolase
MTRLEVARAICDVGRRLAERGLIAGAEGNIAVRVAPDRVLVTPRGRGKGDLAPTDIVEVDLEGRQVRGGERASSELLMHLTILRARRDVQAVVHAHPPVATGFATAGQSVNCDCVPEMLAAVGWVPLVPYGTPGTAELSERLLPVLGDHVALLLANHGAVTLGRTLREAHYRMESLEQAARILLVSRLVGGPVALSPADVAVLASMRDASRGRDR